MNRTDRLYAMVEELRAIAPRPRSARWLAQRFEVCTRTVERDIGALQQSGVPIYAEPGRTGGYTLDKARTLPPVNVTPAEAVAIAVALRRLAGTPFQDAARSAVQKLVAVMPEPDVARAEAFGRRVHFVEQPGAPQPPRVPGVIADALSAGRVLRLEYADRHDAVSRRFVEPLGYLGGREHWYLLAWCRLRDSVRVFRLDRIRSAAVTDEVAPGRPFDPAWLDIPSHVVTSVTLGDHTGRTTGVGVDDVSAGARRVRANEPAGSGRKGSHAHRSVRGGYGVLPRPDRNEPVPAR